MSEAVVTQSPRTASSAYLGELSAAGWRLAEQSGYEGGYLYCYLVNPGFCSEVTSLGVLAVAIGINGQKIIFLIEKKQLLLEGARE